VIRAIRLSAIGSATAGGQISSFCWFPLSRFPAFPLSDLAAAPPRCVLCGKISPVIPMALALFAYFAWFAVKISAFPLCFCVLWQNINGLHLPVRRSLLGEGGRPSGFFCG
jgi:hypothetical protein